MKVDLWKAGVKIGTGECELIDGALVLKEYAPIIHAMKEAAKADGVDLTLAVGIRTFDQQIDIRKKYVVDKSKVNDLNYILTAPVTSKNFSPLAAKPGFSNHGHGKAYDWNVTGKPDSYKWLIANALKFGMYRTIPSERWHWEINPKVTNMFTFVPKTDTSWDGLV